MPDTYRSPVLPIKKHKDVAYIVANPTAIPVSDAGGGINNNLLSFQAGMSVGLLTAGV